MQIRRKVKRGFSGKTDSVLFSDHPAALTLVHLADDQLRTADKTPNVAWRSTDYSQESLEEIFRGASAVIHLAGTKGDKTELEDFAGEDGYKILLCHHPEYWSLRDPMLRDKRIDLVLSGHAHGGQWRICGRGLFAHTRPEDLQIEEMNFGWETPGTFDCAVQIRGLSLRGQDKS